jgi:hypothetical protein
MELFLSMEIQSTVKCKRSDFMLESTLFVISLIIVSISAICYGWYKGKKELKEEHKATKKR